jgi:hypothetical protein
MRAAFGLVSLLVTIGVMIWIMSAFYLPSAQMAINTRQSLEPQLEQITLQGAPASIRTTPQYAGGKLAGLTVTLLPASGMLARYYGLQPNDVITEIGPFAVRDTDQELAEAQLIEAPRNHHTLVVVRNGQRLALAPSDNPAPPPRAGPAAGTPAAPVAVPPAPGGTQTEDAMKKQVDLLKNIPGLR